MIHLVGDERTARMFLFDVMFFRSPRSHVMINVFFDTWPEIMFWTGQGNSNIDPLLETIIWMIYNTGPSTSLADMKVYLNTKASNNIKPSNLWAGTSLNTMSLQFLMFVLGV